MMMIRLTAKQLSWVGWHLRLNPLSRYYIWGRLCLVCDFMQVFVSHLPQWAWRRYEFDSQAGEGEKSTVWPVCVFTLGCQRWLMPCVLKVEAWRFSSVLTKPSSCAANCLSPCVRSVSVNEHEGCLHVRQGSAAPCCLPQHRRAVSCIAVTGHWAARLEHGSLPSSLFHYIWRPCSGNIHANKRFLLNQWWLQTEGLCELMRWSAAPS